MTNKTTALFIGMLLLGVLMFSFASADCSVTFHKGEKEIFCNPDQTTTCGHTSCIVCMSRYNQTRGCYTSGNPDKCNYAGSCDESTGSIGNTTFDLSPAMLKILSPINGTISKSTKLFLNFSLSEVANVYYKDLNKNTNIWTMVCSNCNAGNPAYARLRSFSEGENNLLFKSVDNADNINYTSVKFIVDSTAPRIYSTLPKLNGAADGNFQVQFIEANPKKVILYYGTDSANVNLSKCYPYSTKTICDIWVNLSKYKGQTISYYFNVSDIATNSYASNPINVKVNGSTGGNTQIDITPPKLKILNPLNNTVYSSRKILLNFSLDEIADVYYRDLNKNTNTWTRVCTKCSVGNPSYKVFKYFNEGLNNFMFKAIDTSGNEAYVSTIFIIDSISPRIYTTLPKSNSFADGEFQVAFKEANPKRLTLNYGTDKINLNLSKCYDSMSKKICDITVNLNKYEGKKIPYFFDIEDIAGNTYKSRALNISIDTKAPVVNNPSKFLNITGRYVDFNINITEPNFYKAVFIRTNSQTMTQTTICTRLVNGMCTKHQSFSKGNYSLSIQIIDKAGHAIAIPANFSIK